MLTVGGIGTARAIGEVLPRIGDESRQAEPIEGAETTRHGWHWSRGLRFQSRPQCSYSDASSGG